MSTVTVNSLLAYGAPLILVVGCFTLLRRQGMRRVRVLVSCAAVYVVGVVAVLIGLGATGRL